MSDILFKKKKKHLLWMWILNDVSNSHKVQRFAASASKSVTTRSVDMTDYWMLFKQFYIARRLSRQLLIRMRMKIRLRFHLSIDYKPYMWITFIRKFIQSTLCRVLFSTITPFSNKNCFFLFKSQSLHSNNFFNKLITTTKVQKYWKN